MQMLRYTEQPPIWPVTPKVEQSQRRFRMSGPSTSPSTVALQEQHPDLAGLAIREVTGGWGNQMWRLGDELAVRMQRMDPNPEPHLKERRWLPVLAPRLPLPVPTPVRFGEPSSTARRRLSSQPRQSVP